VDQNGGKVFSSKHDLLFTFSKKRELVEWCKEQQIPYKRLYKEGHYDPPVGRRNKNLAIFFGTYIVYDDLNQ